MISPSDARVTTAPQSVVKEVSEPDATVTGTPTNVPGAESSRSTPPISVNEWFSASVSMTVPITPPKTGLKSRSEPASSATKSLLAIGLSFMPVILKSSVVADVVVPSETWTSNVTVGLSPKSSASTAALSTSKL